MYVNFTTTNRPHNEPYNISTFINIYWYIDGEYCIHIKMKLNIQLKI